MAVHLLETFSVSSPNRTPFMEENTWSLSWGNNFQSGTFTFDVTHPGGGGSSEKVTVELRLDEGQYKGSGTASKSGTTYRVIGQREHVDVQGILNYFFFVGVCTPGDFSDDDDVDGFTAIDQGPGEEQKATRRKRFFGLF